MTIEHVDQTARFVLNCRRVEIRLKIEPTRNRPEAVYVGFTGMIAGASGQCDGAIREALDEAEAEGFDGSDAFARVLDAWSALHLQPVLSLTAEQAEQLVDARVALSELDGGRFGKGVTFEDVGEADFNNAQDVIDSRDVIARIEELESAFDSAGLDPLTVDGMTAEDLPEGLADSIWEAAAELKTLKALESEASGHAVDWEHGETLIRDSYFVEYAEEMVKDTCELPRDIPSFIEIDWEKTAEHVKQDYTSVEFDGVTYWIL